MDRGQKSFFMINNQYTNMRLSSFEDVDTDLDDWKSLGYLASTCFMYHLKWLAKLKASNFCSNYWTFFNWSLEV